MKREQPKQPTPPATKEDRLKMLRQGPDLQRMRSKEERHRLIGKRRIIAAVERCNAGNFDDLDYLLDLYSSSFDVAAGTDPATYDRDLMEFFRKTAGCKNNNELRSKLERLKEQRKASEISAEYIRELFSSQEFNQALAETIRLFQESHGNEAGFAILKHPKNRTTWYSKPVVAKRVEKPDEVAIWKSRRALERKVKKDIGLDAAIIGDLHFHGEAGEVHALTPSSHKGADLEIASELRRQNKDFCGLDIIPIQIILTRSLADKDFFVLVYREPEDFSMEGKKAVRQELHSALEYTNDQEEVLRLLRNYRYKVAFFKTKDHRFPSEELEKLSDFAYTPKRIT